MISKERFEEILTTELPPKEELARAWDSWVKLPKEDRLIIILHLCKKCPHLCATQFFVKVANDFQDMVLPPVTGKTGGEK